MIFKDKTSEKITSSLYLNDPAVVAKDPACKDGGVLIGQREGY